MSGDEKTFCFTTATNLSVAVYVGNLDRKRGLQYVYFDASIYY